MEAILHNQKGENKGGVKLSAKVFGLPWNADLVHQVIVAMTSNRRAGTANARTRAEVRGGGKKPWKQKGTGRARHGSRRSPIWKGGGVTHGPLAEKNYDKKINKKMKVKALYTILSQKFKDGEILFVDKFTMDKIKTQEADQILKNLGKVKGFEKMNTKRKNAAYIYIPAKDEKVEKSFRNIKKVTLDEIRNINPLSLVEYKYLIMVDPTESVKFIESKI